MTERDIARFFESFAEDVNAPLTVVLVGGAAAALLGHTRPTLDVDFEVIPPRGRERDPDWGGWLEGAVARAERAAGLTAQFSTDIDRWGMVALPFHRKRVRPWRRFGKLTVALMDPASYVASKLRRGLEEDFADVRFVVRRTRARWREVAGRCAEALGRSTPSTALAPFVKVVEHFLRREGPKLWGGGYDPEAAVRFFRVAARRSGPGRIATDVR